MNGLTGAFFTPVELADELALHIPFIYGRKVRILDLCAGIGALTFSAQMECSAQGGLLCQAEYVCVEVNPAYVEVGKQLVPDAEWHCADALDPNFLEGLGQFHCVISNPPHGRINTDHRKHYSSGLFEYMVIEASSKLAKHGVFLIPQMSAPFVYSGTNRHEYLKEGRAIDFQTITGIELGFGIGVDTAVHRNRWHSASPLCEIVSCEFENTLTA